MSVWDHEAKKASEKLETFILEQKWEDFPEKVKERAIVCTVDLIGGITACAKTVMARNGVILAKKVFPGGEIPIIGTNDMLSQMGAVMAYGYNVNALDIDDGHNMIKGHPGAVLMAGILPTAMEVGASYKEMLEALVIGYEVAIRAGLALHQYYGFYHGTGSWGAFGTAAAIAKLRKVNKSVLSHALGIADYQGPVAPVMRIVEIPSMNKDGIAWGAMTGAMAVEAAQCGITGKFYNLIEPENQRLVYTLGKEYEIMNLYFKFFPCCRWAHAPIVAALNLKKKYALRVEDIKCIKIYTFRAATALSSIVPEYSDEAQYNMIYPVCAAIVEGDFTPVQVSEKYIREHPQVLKLMDKAEYFVKEEFEDKFPRKRFAQLEIITKQGQSLLSETVEPYGEQEENIGLEWIEKKFRHITGHCLSSDGYQRVINYLGDAENDFSIKELVFELNKMML